MKAAIINLVLLAASASAWSVAYHTDSDCRGDIVAHSNLPNAARSESVCEAPGVIPGSDPSIRVRSARISGLDEELDEDRWSASTRTTVRFYSNNDCLNNCTHRYVLDQRDWDDCVSFYGSSWNSKGLKTDSPSIALKDISFNVVKLGRVGSLSNHNSGEYSAALSDGFCLLSHGDKVVVHGREYRMQQVAASWFHDIPAKDWNDAIHTKSTENRFAQHGDIDVTGDKKMWQQTADYSHSIPLEQWNDLIHVKAEAGEEANDDLMYAIDRYCRVVALNDTVVVQDMLNKVPSLNVAKVCEEVKRKLKEIEQEELALMAEEFGDVLVEQT